MTRSGAWQTAAALLIAAFLGGCEGTVEPDPTLEELSKARDEIDRLRQENDRLATRLGKAEARLAELMKLGDKRLEQLYVVQRIRLGKGTGGVDQDKHRGHDAVKVFLEPIDQHGSVLKAPGSVTIRVFDLGADPNGTLLAERQYTGDQTAAQWSSGFLAYHYSFTCPLDTPPVHDELTVRVEFVDFLTGEKHTAQQVVQVVLPPGPETQPAGKSSE